MRRRGEFEGENSDRWLMTYADLITLLLAFFVIMYAMSKVDAKKFEQMSQNLQGEFNASDAQKGAATTDLGAGVLKIGRLKLVAQRLESPSFGQLKHRVSLGPATNIPMSSGFDNSSTGDSTQGQFSVELNERGLVVHVVESALFNSGQADIQPRAREVLDRIAAEIRTLPNQIRIEGHTDSLPISSFKYPSNWELSAARATAIVRYFVDRHAFSPERVSALGFGEFRPLVPNDTPENRARNRRVDIVILTDALSRFEPRAKLAEVDSLVAGNNLQSSVEELSPY
ncbi:MAG: flagellar motor protein MotB [Candidatus Zixiibacteriota bacterium]